MFNNLSLKKITFDKLVNSFIGKSNNLHQIYNHCLYLIKVGYAKNLKGERNQKWSVFFGNSLPHEFEMVFNLALFFLHWQGSILSPYTWAKEHGKKGECVNRNLKQILKKILWRHKNILESNFFFFICI